ncbi:MAG: YdeI/OmpD-associated family protein [Planctomycetota bacterium]
MPEPDPKKIKSFAASKDLAAWLRKNHAKADELWVKVFKKGTRKPSVTWGEIVTETLCWGWIDGVKKSLGDEAYLQRITPRKPRSGWSKRNTEQVERLIEEGRMEKPGLAQVEAAKADGRWENAYAPASEMEIPDDFVAAVKKKPKARKTFDELNKTNRYAIAYGLTTAKRPETRERRFEKFLGMLTRGEKPDFGFKKK